MRSACISLMDTAFYLYVFANNYGHYPKCITVKSQLGAEESKFSIPLLDFIIMNHNYNITYNDLWFSIILSQYTFLTFVPLAVMWQIGSLHSYENS